MKAFVSGCSSHARCNFLYLLSYGETARSDCYHVSFCVLLAYCYTDVTVTLAVTVTAAAVAVSKQELQEIGNNGVQGATIPPSKALFCRHKHLLKNLVCPTPSAACTFATELKSNHCPFISNELSTLLRNQ